MLIPFLVQFIYNEKNNIFLSSAAVTAFIGVLLVLTNLEENRKLNLQQAFLLTTLSWLSIAFFGCIPFLFSSINLSFVDSFFESMSGITTTGATIINNLDDMSVYIIYCNGYECSLSLDLADYLYNEKLFEKVLVFEGGWPEWRDAGYP